MRVIKFRAWDIEDKKMLYFNGIFNQRPYTEQSCFIQYESCPKYHNLEIMQFIGLLDRNGKEIYEGDLVKVDANYNYSGDHWYDAAVGVVEYVDDSFLIINTAEKYGVVWQEFGWSTNVEVIDNIFENPEKST